MARPVVEVMTDLQLQVEHALDLDARERVAFVDAGEPMLAPYELRRVEAAADFSYSTHAISPEGLSASAASRLDAA